MDPARRLFSNPINNARVGSQPLATREVVELCERAHALSRIAARGLRSSQKAAIAQDLGVSTRTVDRYRHRRIEVLTIRGWQAAFALYPHRSPVQVTPWERE